MEHSEARGQIQQERQPQPWGKLIRLGAEEAEPHVLLLKKECTIGRKKGCDLSFPGNKLVSGDHCKIIVDEESGHVLLEDTSTNGTVINKQKVVKKQFCPLQTGDVIYVVYRKNEPENNVAYLYESLNPKEDPAHEPAGASVESMCHVTKDTSSTGQSDDGTSLAPPPSVRQPCYDEPSTSSNLFNTASTSLAESIATEQGGPVTSGKGSLSYARTPAPDLPALAARGPEASLEHKQPNGNTEASNISSGDQEKTASAAPKQKGRDGEAALEPPKKKIKGDGDAGSLLQGISPNERAIKTGPEDTKPANMKPDKMEETLTCIICQELLHDCVSLQPCMHTFCAACYSGWMERSSLCPTCRCPVERICKNHILNNLVEAYLIQHPDKCRNEEDVQSMDARNKITQDMLQPKVRRSFSDEEGSSEDLLELSDVDSESSDISQPYVVCRQCPGYRLQPVLPAASPAQEGEPEAVQALGDAPSTSANFPAAAQEYVCPSQGSHVICTCCFQPMPDRRAEREQNPHIAPQQCAVCLQPFCHLYWGCTRVACFGCLAPFSEINLGDKCLDGVLNGNNYESDILKDYLASRGLTWRNMLSESLLALQRGVFILPDYRITGETVLCYCCGLRSFRELAYQYRQNIPMAELPVAVTSRPDCYWGRNCRTQVKAHHAMKFNHICEQTRFKN
ncbi:E3 ubiquitin-protein ligase CHFR isoform X1 [Varanus komodoensis]|uniref:E3 ubiquitin-protein ligase CHFR isoform X1 n=1 Tax=Varanus komodoensis TaxID=61221 RepID=UPI001CF77568|nr:E3 ubiquitin-protein ligase CHFR isoform X1 [Varanus komodoensis]XP_044296645.1 E3 ubiquitin-protein ligase CHFR isoform X1 [Varanus komodoensis]XP_044296646.1 E3 ubiquitin-protein ligase CHFR isoform X1 [Varanus komodoensis]